MKINIPHIHKIEGEAGFWANVTKTGKIDALRLEVLTGARQIEGILIGRKAQEVPLVVARICGICPVVHILNSCCAIESALKIKVSPLTVSLRKLFLASQMIHSHALHLFFLTLADFFSIENDIDLMKKFPKEGRAALKIRDFSLRITEAIGGRKVHPLTSQIGGFSKMPEKEELRKILKDFPVIFENAHILGKVFSNLPYPNLRRKNNFVSVFSEKEYPFYKEDFIMADGKKFSAGDFYSNEIEEDLKGGAAKRVKYHDKSYMVGAIARIKNNGKLLLPEAKNFVEEFKKKNNLSDQDFFENNFYNLFSQMAEILHFLAYSKNMIEEIIEQDLKETQKQIKITKGSGLSAMEAPRGAIFHYFEIDKNGRIENCNIITPSAQFLNNIEEDLKVYIPNILSLSEKDKIIKIRSLIRAYDPCISCAIH